MKRGNSTWPVVPGEKQDAEGGARAGEAPSVTLDGDQEASSAGQEERESVRKAGRQQGRRETQSEHH